MKKKLLATWVAVCIFASIMPTTGYAEEKQKAVQPAAVGLATNARSAILMDADTGTVIFEKNSHDQLPPASITKVMTMLLTMEALDTGKLKLTDLVRTSEYAASMGGSQIFLEPGEEMPVDEMLKGIAMASGNDASVAMAEKIAGSEEAFVQMMNDRAKELGLKDTHFSNCNGLPTTNHYSSAHDIAVISRELLKHNEITKYTGSYQDYLRKDSKKPFWLVNTNKLVRFYTGADGLKTGYTSEAKFCLTATAKKDGLRAIAVVMGEPNTKTRNEEVSKMFDYLFSQFSLHTIFKSGDVMGTVDVNKGKMKKLTLTAGQTYSILTKKNTKNQDIRHELQIPKEIKAPIESGQYVGKLVVYQGDQKLKEFELKSPEQVGKAGWWMLFKRTMSKLFLVD
ncbi:D-alanyl-D-alanine carboxypeptidase family protein [Paenibacillus pini]|uniref:serine-type D-Ala-D-Ala carboxypeptidase n=1 Tax=Paenibacillus pini JCM 16418 TaxID=1236976 RepID=W7YWD5_9BACL|nr:D-alanyl-D-alanine carboxypeptidase family protein [Paenibacillus pini]GAF08976.1 D-alanyl-D-alanine carboxypeptidase [Paenibacillus pini JCM 16418]